MKDILGMLFAEDNFPDIGSIKKADDGTLILKEQDIPKLNNVLTRAVCVGTYNVPVFGFNTGHVAVCPKASRAFMYESTDDEWYELG